MGTQKTHHTTYGRYVGRVGALAATLGIGVLVGTCPAIAGADTGDTSAESSSQSATTSAQETDQTDGERSTTKAQASTGEANTDAEDDFASGDDLDDTQTQTPDEESPATDEPDTDDGHDADTDSLSAPVPTETPVAEELPVSVTIEEGSSAADGRADATTKASRSQASIVPVESSDTVNATPEHEADEAPVAPTRDSAQSNNTARSATVETVSVTPVGEAAPPVRGFFSLLNSVVTNLLNPFLAPAPSTGEPITPVVWGVLGWVRRNLFNQAPVVSVPTTISQTGQTVTGNIGVIDAEGDELFYVIKQQPKSGTVTIDQATGTFTYTPNDINYTAIQEDSFKVSVSDRGFNLLGLLTPRSVKNTVDVDVLNPQVQRVILNMPDTVTKPVNPRYSQDGKSIFFSGTPTAGGRAEIYEIDVDDIDGSTVRCVTCGAAPSETGGLFKPVPFTDGSGRVLVLQNGLGATGGPRYSVFEPTGYLGNTEARIVQVITPPGGGATLPGLPPGGVLEAQREMRPSPDGKHVVFTRIVFGQTGGLQALPIVGELTRSGDQYTVTDAVVVWPTGEAKQWTPDGKGVIILGGAIDAGNVDDIVVDVSGKTGTNLIPGSPFKAYRITGNLDYDEDIDVSPNMQWIAVGSTRGFEALTPMTRIIRQNFLPVYVGAAVYAQYADDQVRNVSNQNWLVAIEDDLKRENGIPLFVQDDPSTPGVDEGDGWASRSMPSWNADGTAITFWESGNGDEHGVAPTESRIVIANVKYTTSVGPVGNTATDFDASAFPALSTYVAKATPLPPTGTYNGAKGGSALVSEVVNPTTFQTTRTVTYTNYVNEDGLILNGTESSTYGPSQSSVTYLADIDVTDATGASRGNLDANAVVNAFTQSVTGHITSTLDGDTQTIPDPAKAEEAKTGA